MKKKFYRIRIYQKNLKLPGLQGHGVSWGDEKSHVSASECDDREYR
jgi:hypothetical protein